MARKVAVSSSPSSTSPTCSSSTSPSRGLRPGQRRAAQSRRFSGCKRPRGDRSSSRPTTCRQRRGGMPTIIAPIDRSRSVLLGCRRRGSPPAWPGSHPSRVPRRRSSGAPPCARWPLRGRGSPAGDHAGQEGRPFQVLHASTEGLPGLQSATAHGADHAALRAVLAAANETEALRSFAEQIPSMNDIFLQLIGKDAQWANEQIENRQQSKAEESVNPSSNL